MVLRVADAFVCQPRIDVPNDRRNSDILYYEFKDFCNAIAACNIIDCIVCSLKDHRTTAVRGFGSHSPHMREINVVDKHVIHHHPPNYILLLVL